MRWRSVLSLAVAGALLGTSAACSPPGPPSSGQPSPPAAPGATGPTGPAPDLAGPTGPATAEPAVPPPPAPLPVTSIEARLGAATLVLPVDGSPDPVDPAATFEVRLGVAAPGSRLVLLDGRDAMVPSTGDVEIGNGLSRFTLVPHETLVPAARYVLRIEGLDSRAVRSNDGRSFEPVAVAFRVSGEPPAPPPKKVKKKRAR